mmetsp:Transcript_3366/g.7307  ORF Transcript_3366/g.7307 Transcript_3366/m.7307 type:complete len:251 (+) Transcript_3366:667-1419(+)
MDFQLQVINDRAKNGRRRILISQFSKSELIPVITCIATLDRDSSPVDPLLNDLSKSGSNETRRYRYHADCHNNDEEANNSAQRIVLDYWEVPSEVNSGVDEAIEEVGESIRHGAVVVRHCARNSLLTHGNTQKEALLSCGCFVIEKLTAIKGDRIDTIRRIMALRQKEESSEEDPKCPSSKAGLDHCLLLKTKYIINQGKTREVFLQHEQAKESQHSQISGMPINPRAWQSTRVEEGHNGKKVYKRKERK